MARSAVWHPQVTRLALLTRNPLDGRLTRQARYAPLARFAPSCRFPRVIRLAQLVRHSPAYRLAPPFRHTLSGRLARGIWYDSRNTANRSPVRGPSDGTARSYVTALTDPTARSADPALAVHAARSPAPAPTLTRLAPLFSEPSVTPAHSRAARTLICNGSLPLYGTLSHHGSLGRLGTLRDYDPLVYSVPSHWRLALTPRNPRLG
jgi:hypothetical protein